MGIQAMFLGGASRSVITAQSSVITDESSESAFAAIRFASTGEQVEIFSRNQVSVGYWVLPASGASEWEIRATLDSGSTPSGDLGVWQGLNPDREWGLSRSNVGFSTSTLTFEFRKVGGSFSEYTISGNSITVTVGNPF